MRAYTEKQPNIEKRAILENKSSYLSIYLGVVGVKIWDKIRGEIWDRQKDRHTHNVVNRVAHATENPATPLNLLKNY